MTLAERVAHVCATPNCDRSTDWPTPPSRALLCRDCTTHFLHDGRLPVIPPTPEWRKRLTARDMTGAIYGRDAA